MARKDKATEKDSIELPDVKDIPGQEHVRPPRLGELADTTASSADEEGDDILGDDDELVSSNDSNVTPTERRVLENVEYRRADSEDQPLLDSALDNTDEDGAPLNEGSFGRDLSGDDLDVPGADEDDADEEIGEEDEENNEYSLDNQDHEIPED